MENVTVCIPPKEYRWVNTVNGTLALGRIDGLQVSDIRAMVGHVKTGWAWAIKDSVFYGVETSLDDAVRAVSNHMELFGRTKGCLP